MPFARRVNTFIPLNHLAFILLLSLAPVNFFLRQIGDLSLRSGNYLGASACIYLITWFMLLQWRLAARLFQRFSDSRFFYASIVLFPIALLFFWDPQLSYPHIAFPLLVVVFTQFCFAQILSDNGRFGAFFKAGKKKILIIIGAYALVFLVVVIRKYNSFSIFNPVDFAIYNQTFFNSIHGRLFQNSSYGSNFACHNSPFFFLLMPVYYLFRSPQTLLITKTLLLALSALPLYLIIRDILSNRAIIALIAAFLFYPSLIAQNFVVPHEMTYAPFFILFALYFYLRCRFWPFIFFLLISLSIKEQIGFVAFVFGLVSLVRKRSARWSVTPIVLGLLWIAFSLWIINHFRNLYASPAGSAWFIDDLARRFPAGKGGFFRSFSLGLSTSNIADFYTVRQLLVYLGPLCVIFPLLSPISLIGLPELLLALVSNRPAMLDVTRHYTIIFSCFIFVGAVFGVRKASFSSWMKRSGLPGEKAQVLSAFFILSAVIMHTYTWMGLAKIGAQKYDAPAVKEALSLIPENAFVVVPGDIAAQVSSRTRYGVLGQEQFEKGDYILIHHGSGTGSMTQSPDMEKFNILFNRSGIILLERKK